MTTKEGETKSAPRLDELIDEALEDSFPASDPPFWTLGVTRGGAQGPLERRQDRYPKRSFPTGDPAEPERHDRHVGISNPNTSTWSFEQPYHGPPEGGQPRKGSAPHSERGEPEDRSRDTGD